MSVVELIESVLRFIFQLFFFHGFPALLYYASARFLVGNKYVSAFFGLIGGALSLVAIVIFPFALIFLGFCYMGGVVGWHIGGGIGSSSSNKYESNLKDDVKMTTKPTNNSDDEDVESDSTNEDGTDESTGEQGFQREFTQGEELDTNINNFDFSSIENESSLDVTDDTCEKEINQRRVDDAEITEETAAMPQTDEADLLEKMILENNGWLEDISITLTESNAIFEFYVDVFEQFNNYSGIFVNVLKFLNEINIGNLPSNTSINFIGTKEEVRITVDIREEVVSQIESKSSLTEDLVKNTGMTLLHNTVVSGDAADQLYTQWVLQTESVGEIYINNRHLTLRTEHTYFNQTEVEVLKEIIDNIRVALFITVSFVGENAAYDLATFETVSQNGETMVTFELTADLADQIHTGELASEELTERLIQTKKTNTPEPENDEAARERFISVCRRRMSDYLTIDAVVPTGDTLEIKYQMGDPSERAAEEGSLVPKTSITMDEMLEIVCEDIIEFTEISVIGYTSQLGVDRITFLACVPGSPPTLMFHIESEWVNAYHEDDLDATEVVEHTIDTLDGVSV